NSNLHNPHLNSSIHSHSKVRHILNSFNKADLHSTSNTYRLSTIGICTINSNWQQQPLQRTLLPVKELVTLPLLLWQCKAIQCLGNLFSTQCLKRRDLTLHLPPQLQQYNSPSLTMLQPWQQLHLV